MPDHKVALCLVEEANDFQQLLRSDAVSGAKRAGLGLDVHFSGHDLAAQLNQLRALVDSSPRPAAILVLAVRDQGHAPGDRSPARAGDAILFLNQNAAALEAH